jgi:Domain of unknown function (DUF6249)
MGNELWIPIAAFVSVAAVLGLFVYLRFRAKQEYQRTVRVAIERGHQLSPELLERIGETLPASGSQRDLRIGVTSIALGVGLASFGWLLGEQGQGATRVFLAIGNIPFLVGIALVALWKFAPRDDR